MEHTSTATCKDNYDLQVSGMYCFRCVLLRTDRQTTDVRYEYHTKKCYSSHTNLTMAEHSTNAKFYTHFKVPMTLYVSKLHGSLVEISQCITVH